MRMFQISKIFIFLVCIFWIISCSSPTSENIITSIDEINVTDEENKINAHIITNSNYEIQVSGEASGTWFFEAEFWLELLDENNNLLSEWFVTAEWEWMTVEYVPFKGKIAYLEPETEYGYLVLKRSNPSWLEEHDLKKSVKVKIK